MTSCLGLWWTREVSSSSNRQILLKSFELVAIICMCTYVSRVRAQLDNTLNHQYRGLSSKMGCIGSCLQQEKTRVRNTNSTVNPFIHKKDVPHRRTSWLGRPTPIEWGQSKRNAMRPLEFISRSRKAPHGNRERLSHRKTLDGRTETSPPRLGAMKKH